MHDRTTIGTIHFPLLAALSLAALTVVACTGRAPNYTSRLAIENVSVIDVVEGEAIEERTVVLKDNRIVEVAPASKVRLGEGVQRIDGAGRYLIPGLWDMHIHSVAIVALDVGFRPGMYGAYQAILKDSETGVYYGASDSRMDG